MSHLVSKQHTQETPSYVPTRKREAQVMAEQKAAQRAPRLLDALKQYVGDAAPGGALNPEWTPDRVNQAKSTALDFTPVIGGVKGAKEEWDAGNPVLAAFNAATVPLDLATFGTGGAALKGLAAAGITALHASPYKFDKFSTAHLGSGQGATSYGPGLYFAESPAVLKEYEREFLAKVQSQLGSIENNIVTQKRIFDNKANSVEKRTEAKKLMDQYQKELIDTKKVLTPTSYTVDLPDEQVAKMLDYDAPLQGFGDTKTVKDLLSNLEKQGMTHKEIADYFISKGIPGIRYLDARSRGVGGGTSNYVVFDDSIIKSISSRPIK